MGKSSLMLSFTDEKFMPDILPTVGLDFRVKVVEQAGYSVKLSIWDTAGQERFNTMHRSYYHQASACILVFDSTRKITYKNLSTWFTELKQYRPHIPALLAANKIDENMDVTSKNFGFATKNNLPLYYVSASNGTNVVKLFR